jgi:hypothetical protein
VEITPGHTYVSIPPDNIDTVAITELVPAGGGTFRPVARICPRWFTVARGNLKRLGIAISEQGMARLIRAKFVTGMNVTPGVMQFDYFSYLKHEADVAGDPEFWDRTEPGARFSNRERYRQAL